VASLQTKADNITGTDQNTGQLELGVGIWSTVFTSPTIVILMITRTKGNISLYRNAWKSVNTDVL